MTFEWNSAVGNVTNPTGKQNLINSGAKAMNSGSSMGTQAMPTATTPGVSHFTGNSVSSVRMDALSSAVRLNNC